MNALLQGFLVSGGLIVAIGAQEIVDRLIDGRAKKSVARFVLHSGERGNEMLCCSVYVQW